MQEEGQCGFFQWQDQPELPRKQAKQGESVGEQQDRSQEADDGLQAPETPQCKCGLEAVEITSHSATNPGRVFYKCPKNEVGTSMQMQHVDGHKKSDCVCKSHVIRCTAMTILVQAEGRCKFFKWQDELLNAQTASQQQSGPVIHALAVQGFAKPANTSQPIPPAATGGSGVFADGGMQVLKGLECQVAA